MTLPRPLEGLVVLDFTRVYSGPYATLLLADLGAEVIKVEHPAHGDDSRSFGPLIAGTSGYFETLNRGKKSLALDYRSPQGQEVIRTLIQHVDVLIENFRPGQMAAYTLDYAALAAQNPRLIYASISGYGQLGPNAHLGCYDVVAQAVSGLMSLTGLQELPIKTGPAIADAISGLTAAVGLLVALWGRERHGHGSYVDVAMVDSVFACLENALAEYSVTGQAQPRQGNQDAALAPFDVFCCGDAWVAIGIGSDRLWSALAQLVGQGLDQDARFVTNAGRLAHYHELRPLLEQWCASLPPQALLGQLHEAGIPAGLVRTIDDLAADAQLEARGMLARIRLEENTEIMIPGCPIHVMGVERPSAQRGPKLGEHTASLLARFGVSASTIMALARENIVRL